MRNLLTAIKRFSGRQKLAAGALLLLVVLTWVAVCLILTGYIGP